MKHFIFSSLLAACVLIACNSNKTKDTATTEETSKDKTSAGTNSEDTNTSSTDAMTQKMEELKKLTPLTTDQLKGMVPEEFMGMKRSNLNVSSGMGVAAASATYKGDGEKELRVNVYDCAGEAGAGIYSIRYYTLWNFEQSDDNGYQKTIDLNGGKAIEKYSKGNDEYELTYVDNDRLLVTLEGQKMGLDEVKEAAKNLNLK